MSFTAIAGATKPSKKKERGERKKKRVRIKRGERVLTKKRKRVMFMTLCHGNVCFP